MATARIIELLLDDGTLDGLLTVQDSSWNGTMFVSPRDSIDQLLRKKETTYWGVYLLLSAEGVYIGQASELKTRLRQHYKAKDFWSKCVLFTTKDDSLNRSGIDYIEAVLIDKAKHLNRLHIENKQKGNKTNVSQFEKVRFDNYIDNALLLLELIGITVFKPEVKKHRKQKTVVAQPNRDDAAVSTSCRVELADGFTYEGKSHRDCFLRTIEHLAATYPQVYNDLKVNFVRKNGRRFVRETQVFSSSHSPLYSRINNGDFIYTNMSANTMRKNLDQYLAFFHIQRII